MCSLHGPYTLPQPIDQREIVSSAAKECLAKMNVSLNKARNDGAISGIDYGIGSVTCTTSPPPSRGTAWASPPCARATARTIDKPSPKPRPPSTRSRPKRRNGWKSVSISYPGTTGPVFDTVS